MADERASLARRLVPAVLVAALLSVIAHRIATRLPEGRPSEPVELLETLTPLFRDATFVRPTEQLQAGSERARLHLTQADLRLFERAHGALSRPDGDPPFAWLVGRSVTITLDVLLPVERELRLFVADATNSGQRIGVVFNGEPLGVTPLREDGSATRVVHRVPATLQRHGSNRVELQFERTQTRQLRDEPIPLPIAGVLTHLVFTQPAREPLRPGPGDAGLRTVPLEDGPGVVLALPPGALARLPLVLPADDRLVLQYTLRRAGADLQVGLTADGAERVQLDSTRVGEALPNRVRVDLAPWAGQVVMLDFWARAGEDEVWVGPIQLLGAAASSPDAAEVPPRIEVAARPSFLVVVLDALAARHVSGLGYARPTTPNLDALVRRGIVFPQAIAPASYTLASTGSLLTGQSPERHGVDALALDGGAAEALGPDAPSLAGALAAAGWRTAAFVTNPNAGARHGFDAGFARYDALYADPALWDEGVAGAHLPPRLAEFLAEERERPFLAYVHVFEPHAPYDAPADLLERFVRPYAGDADGSRAWLDDYKLGRIEAAPADFEHLADLYDARVALADRVLGELIATLAASGRGDDTVLVVTSDHGEATGEHGWVEHGDLVYEEQLEVPLVVHVPGRDALPQRVPGPATLADVAPTLLALAGVPVPQGMEGLDLLGAPLDRARPLLARSHGTAMLPPKVAWRRGALKLVVDLGTGRRELYDLHEDPLELVDLSTRREASTEWLHRELCRRMCDVASEAIAEDGLDPETAGRLSEIGYAGFTGDGGAATPGHCPLRARLRRL